MEFNFLFLRPEVSLAPLLGKMDFVTRHSTKASCKRVVLVKTLTGTPLKQSMLMSVLLIKSSIQPLHHFFSGGIPPEWQIKM